MSYKTRCTRNKDTGDYTLSYGRGKNKLTGTVVNNDGTWVVGGIITFGDTVFSTKKAAVLAWGTAAEEAYAAPGHEVANGHAKPPAKPTPPSPVARKGPPSFKGRKPKGGPPRYMQSQAPAQGVDRPSHPDYDAERCDVTNDNPYIADPFNPAMFAPQECPVDGTVRRRITSEGVLDEVYRWMQEHVAFKGQLEYPWVRVRKHLMRTFPDEPRYQETAS